MSKILALGNALVDILIRINDDSILKEYNLPKGSMQLVDLETANIINENTKELTRKISSGGSAANTINGIAKLATPAGFIGKTGNDEFGQYFENGLINNKINPILFKSNTPTGRATTFISNDGERTFATYLGAAVEQTADELTSDFFKGYAYFHVEGYLVQNHDLLEKAFQLAKKNKLKTSIDLASYNVVEANLGFLKKVIREYVDIVFANEEEAKAFTGKEGKEAVADIAKICDIAIVKLGKKGSIIKKGGETINIGIIEANCIDTTGAGDLYAAGFLHGLANNYDLEKCGKIGALTAGKVIENIGAGLTEEQWKFVNDEINNIL